MPPLCLGDKMCLVVLMLTLTVSPGCAVWFSEQHASLIHARVSAENVKAGDSHTCRSACPFARLQTTLNHATSTANIGAT